jgi:hypothetical protein
VKRKEKGLLPCNLRAAVVWYPSVRKSPIINRPSERCVKQFPGQELPKA